MQRRQFLQRSFAAAALASASPSTCMAAAGDDASVISLIYGRTWTLLGTTGRLYARDDKVYCELQDRPRHGMTMVVRNYGKMREELEAAKANPNMKPDPDRPHLFMAHDAEGRLILTKELSDAAKWTFAADGSAEAYKQFKSDRDDTLSTARVTHAVGFAKNRYFLGLDSAKETYEIKDGYGKKHTRTIQQLVLVEKEDPSLAIWINDFSGK